LSDLVGGIQAVTLGDEEARRRGSQKTVLERKAPPTFEIAVEMLERQRWVVHESVAETVDALLRGRQPSLQVLTINENGQVTVTREMPSVPTVKRSPSKTPVYSPLPSKEWRATGRVLPFPQPQDWLGDFEEEERSQIASRKRGETLPLHVYPYGVSRRQLEQASHVLNLPVVVTRDVESADAILTLRTHGKDQSKLQHLARRYEVPIHIIKANTISEISRSLQRLLGMDEVSTTEEYEKGYFVYGGSNDEIDALEEARLAVEEIVLPKGQPVDLLPRSAKVRSMQHELVERYNLKSVSFGNEPNRHLRIYPA
ncbi:MAG: single-stranded DNA-binding protein, partial [Coleofasciculus sp. S288]|nr:single-stranded DNA-binding protein [Coleofasciculus sp. S288]